MMAPATPASRDPALSEPTVRCRAREYVSGCCRGNLPFRPSRRVPTPEGISSPEIASLACGATNRDPNILGGAAARHERRDDGQKHMQERSGPYDNG
jgi:hypothetical protein